MRYNFEFIFADPNAGGYEDLINNELQDHYINWDDDISSISIGNLQPAQEALESIKEIVKFLQSVALKGFASMTFHINIRRADIAIKNEYVDLLPNSSVKLEGYLKANDMVTLRTQLAEIDKIADNIIAKL